MLYREENVKQKKDMKHEKQNLKTKPNEQTKN